MKMRSLVALALLLLVPATPLLGDYLQVRHRGPIRAASSSSSVELRTVDPDVLLQLLDDGAQDRGYYHVRTSDGLIGWMYRTLARRFAGELPGGEPAAAGEIPDVAELPNFEPSWPEAGVPDWVLRSKHLIYGMPRLTQSANFTVDGQQVPGVSVLVREGFVVGHYDRFKVPLWVSMRWTRDDFQRSSAEPTFPRPFEPDEELPKYARAEASYNGNVTGFDRGHMARHKDNAAYGRDNSDAGCLMSNVAPQAAQMNRNSWLGVENRHRKAVHEQALGIDTLWVISGTVFEDGEADGFVGNDVGVPQATYKIVAWFDQDGEFQARGLLLHQDDIVDDPARYLTTVDEIEALTGLDFFPDLADAIEDQVEAAEHATIF